MDISVILVNYNTKIITAQCIDSIIKHTSGVKYEIILVDNASSDGSAEHFQSDNRIRFIRSEVNLGFGKANNLGYSIALGKYIFCLNSDTLLLNNALKIFYDKAESTSIKFGCLGSYLLAEDGKPNQSYGDGSLIISDLLKKAIWGTFLNWKSKNCYQIFEDDFHQVPAVIGADMFIPKNVVEENGFFDPRYFMYQEETDMQKTFQEKGYNSYLIHGPQIVHLEGKSNNKNINRYLMQMEGTFVYLKKWEPQYKYYLFRISYALIRIPIMIIHKNYTWNEKVKYIKHLFLKIK